MDEEKVRIEVWNLLRDWRSGKKFRSASGELKSIGTPAIPALLEALKSDDHTIREYAAEILGSLKDKKAVPDLIMSLNDGYFTVKRVSAWALANIGEANLHDSELLKNITVSLIESLDEQDVMIQDRLVEELIKVGKAFSPLIAKAMKDKRKSYYLRDGAAKALEKIGFVGLGIEEQIFCQLALSNEHNIPIHERTVSVLIGALRDNYASSNAIRALGIIEVSNTQLDEIIDILKCGNHEERKCAALALGEIGNKRAIPDLVISLGDLKRSGLDFLNLPQDDGEHIRLAICSSLERILDRCKTPKSVEEFERLLQIGFSELVKKPDLCNLAITKVDVGQLRGRSAKKKNKLIKDQGILLNDIPKPPKKGRIYQRLRRVMNGS
jgi:HEAT repeat protein